MTMPPSPPKVLVIALAEATLDLIIPLAQAGKLPTFKRLMEEGSWGPLRARMPLVTPQMWGTIVTGKNPGEHGAFDFWQRGPDGRFREINGSQFKAKPIWQILGERGLRCGVVNVPFTYPPQPIHGFMISGEDAPGAHRSIASPPSVYDELVRTFGRYRLKDIFPGGRHKEDYLTLIEEDVAKQTDVLEYLVSRKPWEFFLLFYSATAIAQHYFWSDMESPDAANPFRGVVETAYRCLDTTVDRLMKAAGSGTSVCIISECGAGRLQSGVSINTWLEQEGFLRRKTTSVRRHSAARLALAALRTGFQGRLPQSLHFWVNRYLAGVKAWTLSYLTNEDINWAQTQVFSRGKEGDLFVNLRGRDPHGVVSPGAEYEAFRDRVIERLSQLVDPATGQRAVERVYRREELYQGPYVACAPDLIIAWRDTAYQPTEDGEVRGAVFVPRMRERMRWPTTGSHRVDGIFFARGPGIGRGWRVEGIGIADLMPTWLELLGQPAPPGLEGRAITELRQP